MNVSSVAARAALLGVTGFLLTACGGGADSASTPPAPEKKKHPWDLVPSDPVLVAGKVIYERECSLCHNEGEESAPALTRTEEWATRIAKGEETLIKHAIEGFKGDDGHMPARGGTDTLTDEEVSSAVKFLIATQKQ